MTIGGVPVESVSVVNQTACAGFVTCADGSYFFVGGTFGVFPNQWVEQLYTPALADGPVVPNTAPPYVSDGPTSGASADEMGNIYHLSALDSTHTRLHIHNSAGAFVAYWDLLNEVVFVGSNTFSCIGVNSGGTIAYVARPTANEVSGPFTIYAVNLNTGVMTPFIHTTKTGVGGGLSRGINILVLPDDSVIVPWAGSGRTAIGAPARYSAAGVLLNTYTGLPAWETDSLPTAAAYQYTTGGGQPVDGSQFVLAYYTNAAGYGVTVTTIATATGATVDTFDTEGDSGFQWDGPMSAARPAVPPQPVQIAGDCSTGLITVGGSGFLPGAAIDVRDPTGAPAPFTLVSLSSTEIVLHLDVILEGTYCVTITNPVAFT